MIEYNISQFFKLFYLYYIKNKILNIDCPLLKSQFSIKSLFNKHYNKSLDSYFMSD